jgi:hypothetical protein
MWQSIYISFTMIIFKASPHLPVQVPESNGNWPVTGGRLDDCHEMTKRFSPAVKPLRVRFFA